jgi:HlyD family secretion protein
MDVVRERRRKLPRPLLIGGAAAVLTLAAVIAAVAMLREGEGGVLVDRSTIVTDVVRRGTLERSVSAAGTLASEDVHVVSAIEPGTVAALFVKPGASVRGGDAIARLENHDLEAAVIDARSALDVAQAQLVSAREQAAAAALTQQSTLAGMQAQMQEDVTNAQTLETLQHSGLVADSTFRIAQIRADESRRQVSIGQAQRSVGAADQDAKISAAQAQVAQAAAALGAREDQLSALTVRARSPGVVQTVAVDLGSRVEIGAQLAQVADQRSLKAVLQVAEGQVHDVLTGMPVKIDTGNGVAAGRVVRIAPSAQNGSVAVDVRFNGSLPPGARPDLTVDGTIELEKIPDTISIARPAGASDDSDVDLYRIDANGARAYLAHVALGRGSADRVAVRSGLQPGDTVIVSDTSSYDGQSTLRLH